MSSEPIVFIGPGSEWFWSMAQLLVVAVSLFALYRQVKAQAAGNAFARIEGLQRHWESKVMTHARLATALALRQSGTPYPLPGGARLTADYMEDIWDLLQAGVLSIAEVKSTWGLSVQVWWQLLQPLVDLERQREGRLTYPGFEALAMLMAKEMAKDGFARIQLDAETRREYIEQAIARTASRLRVLIAAESDRLPEGAGAATEDEVDRDPTTNPEE